MKNFKTCLLALTALLLFSVNTSAQYVTRTYYGQFIKDNKGGMQSIAGDVLKVKYSDDAIVFENQTWYHYKTDKTDTGVTCREYHNDNYPGAWVAIFDDGKLIRKRVVHSLGLEMLSVYKNTPSNYSGDGSTLVSPNNSYSGGSGSSSRVTCSGCGGTGRCTACGGSGKQRSESYYTDGHTIISNCPSCRGNGRCGVCHGRGSL